MGSRPARGPGAAMIRQAFLRLFALLTLIPGLILPTLARSQQIELPIEQGSVIDALKQLRAGQYVWTPQVAPEGPTMLIVSVASQRAVLYRNGVPIAVTTVSTGRRGHRTPTGVFTVLEKEIEHYSSLYDSAPMPYMQRLTWGGVALHGGNLPGYPASHGCIRLPHAFAQLLYGVTSLGMTVVVTDVLALPRLAPARNPLSETSTRGGPQGMIWHPELAPVGPVSIVISAADARVIVLRNGHEIGSAAVDIGGRIEATTAYVLARTDQGEAQWYRMALSPSTASEPLSPEFWDRFVVDPAFRQAVAAIAGPGTTIVVTNESLVAGSAGKPLTVIEGD